MANNETRGRDSLIRCYGTSADFHSLVVWQAKRLRSYSKTQKFDGRLNSGSQTWPYRLEKTIELCPWDSSTRS